LHRDEKPLVVILAPVRRLEKIDESGRLSKVPSEVLTQQYICVFVDTKSKEGKRAAKSFEMPEGLGIVISSRTATFRPSPRGRPDQHEVGALSPQYGAPDYVDPATPSRTPARRAEARRRRRRRLLRHVVVLPELRGCANGRCR